MFSTLVGLGRFINCQRPEYSTPTYDSKGISALFLCLLSNFDLLYRFIFVTIFALLQKSSCHTALSHNESGSTSTSYRPLLPQSHSQRKPVARLLIGFFRHNYYN